MAGIAPNPQWQREHLQQLRLLLSRYSMMSRARAGLQPST